MTHVNNLATLIDRHTAQAVSERERFSQENFGQYQVFEARACRSFFLQHPSPKTGKLESKRIIWAPGTLMVVGDIDNVVINSESLFSLHAGLKWLAHSQVDYLAQKSSLAMSYQPRLARLCIARRLKAELDAAFVAAGSEILSNDGALLDPLVDFEWDTCPSWPRAVERCGMPICQLNKANNRTNLIQSILDGDWHNRKIAMWGRLLEQLRSMGHKDHSFLHFTIPADIDWGDEWTALIHQYGVDPASLNSKAKCLNFLEWVYPTIPSVETADEFESVYETIFDTPDIPMDSAYGYSEHDLNLVEMVKTFGKEILVNPEFTSGHEADTIDLSP